MHLCFDNKKWFQKQFNPHLVNHKLALKQGLVLCTVGKSIVKFEYLMIMYKLELSQVYNK